MVCTVIIYFCWWNKPLNVNEPIRLVLKPELQPMYGKSEEDWLKEEVVELDSSQREDQPNQKLPLERDYVITRSPPCLLVMTDRAQYDIIVSVAGNNRMMLLEGLFIAIIAGLHAVAWNAYFPTETEARLWRMACIGMCVCPLVAIAFASMSPAQTPYHVGLSKILWHNHQVPYSLWEWLRQGAVNLYELAEVQAVKGSICRRFFHLTILLICLIFLAGYLVGVLYITVESYISLRDPPDGMFVTPRWGDYWPHL